MLSITHSSVECFRTCHRKYFYEYEQCIKPKDTPWALLDGKALHLALELLYRGRLPDIGRGQNCRSWGTFEGLEPIIQHLYEVERPKEEDESEIVRHKSIVWSMVKGYVKAYRADEFTSFKPEVEGQTPIGEGATLFFKADAIVTTCVATYLFETKTTSASDMAKFLEALGLDDQPDTYLYGFRKLDIPAVGVIYNVIRKPKLKQSNFESDEGFLKRIEKALLEDAEKKPEKRKYYFREIVFRSDADLKKYEEEMVWIVEDMKRYLSYRSPKRCGDSYGQKCVYLPLCQGADMEGFVQKAHKHEEYKIGGTNEGDVVMDSGAPI